MAESDDDLAYIRRFYQVPARVGGRVRFRTSDGTQTGVIIGARNAWLRIRFEGQAYPCYLHPAGGVEYLEATSPTA